MAFKVVIVGAGPIGLTAAQALNKAGIDYVVLERRDEVVIDIGATIIVSQGTLRTMSQLGLLDSMRDNGCPLDRTALRSIADDACYCDHDLDVQKVNFGEFGHVLHRANLLSVLYDSFTPEEKKKILTGKKVTEVLSDDNGVEVKCEDGTSYEGSIVIGADGISSAARKAIRDLSIKAGKGDVDGEQPFKTTYRMLWFSAPRPARLKPGRGALSFGKPASVQLLVGKEKCWIFLYERLEKETRERFFYSEKEMLDLMDKWGHLTCDDGLAIRDVFATRYKAGLINVEEGVCKQWSQGRVVLAGDSIHKFTPSAGLGYNNGVQDISVCLNEVIRLVRADPNPSVQALEGAFERYQTIRTPHLLKDYEASAMATRYQAYETFTLWFVDRFLMRFFGFMQRGLLNLGHPERNKISRPLEFLPGTEPFTGKVAWDFPMSENTPITR